MGYRNHSFDSFFGFDTHSIFTCRKFKIRCIIYNSCPINCFGSSIQETIEKRWSVEVVNKWPNLKHLNRYPERELWVQGCKTQSWHLSSVYTTTAFNDAEDVKR
uniref:Uncharacterized protein n=1 Tax=Cacopsylla melanoneura TaxID=428564 RepID=A0A8D9BLH4_9HEMI